MIADGRSAALLRWPASRVEKRVTELIELVGLPVGYLERMRQASLMVEQDADKVSPQKTAAWLARAEHLE